MERMARLQIKGKLATGAKIELIRIADDRYDLTIDFPTGVQFPILMSRTQTMRTLGIKDESW